LNLQKEGGQGVYTDFVVRQNQKTEINTVSTGPSQSKLAPYSLNSAKKESLSSQTHNTMPFIENRLLFQAKDPRHVPFDEYLKHTELSEEPNSASKYNSEHSQKKNSNPTSLNPAQKAILQTQNNHKNNQSRMQKAAHHKLNTSNDQSNLVEEKNLGFLKK